MAHPTDVIPAKAGNHFDLGLSPWLKQSKMDPRFRGDDDFLSLSTREMLQ